MIKTVGELIEVLQKIPKNKRIRVTIPFVSIEGTLEDFEDFEEDTNIDIREVKYHKGVCTIKTYGAIK